MNKDKAINQLKSLIEHFGNGSNDINNDDIDAIRYILDYINKPTIDIFSPIDSDPTKMFEELGYRLVEVEDPITGEICEYDIQYEKFDGSFYEKILFNNSTKLMHTSCELFGKTIDFIAYTPELLKAIDKQTEELGW